METGRYLIEAFGVMPTGETSAFVDVYLARIPLKSVSALTDKPAYFIHAVTIISTSITITIVYVFLTKTALNQQSAIRR